MMTNMARSIELGVEFWNDSCHLGELADAVANGAVGATSNPVIVFAAVKSDQETWLPVLDRLIGDHPDDTEDILAWRLIGEVGARAAAILEPVHARTKGAKGYLSVQVNPKFYGSTRLMVEHGRDLAALAPNIAIKCPATAEGVAAMEQLTALGININATVSFTVAQALAVAEAVERGLDVAEKSGVDMATMHPYVTIMSGRVFDQCKRERDALGTPLDEETLGWSGIAVFKRAWELYQEREYRSTLLCAAYRSQLQWSELVGPAVIQSIPHPWWTGFNAAEVDVARTIDTPVDPKILASLTEHSADFRRAYEPDGLEPRDFVRYGGAYHTLHQFLGGYADYLAFIRGRMLQQLG